MARTGWRHYHTVWAILFLGWFASGIIRNALSPLLPAIREEFAPTFGQAGDLATAYFLAYAAVQFVEGSLGDRRPLRRPPRGGHGPRHGLRQ